MKYWQILEGSLTQLLEIYVAKHCFGTAEALRLAEEVKHRSPDVRVNLRVFDDIPATDATLVFATPSYYLNGRLIFLGNPRLEELVARLQSASSAVSKGDEHE